MSIEDFFTKTRLQVRVLRNHAHKPGEGTGRCVLACEDDVAARKNVRHLYMSGEESQGADEPHVGNDRLIGHSIVFICCLVGLDCNVWGKEEILYEEEWKT